jgi:glycosyltransferase involved in cell wall biosynthesis
MIARSLMAVSRMASRRDDGTSMRIVAFGQLKWCRILAQAIDQQCGEDQHVLVLSRRRLAPLGVPAAARYLSSADVFLSVGYRPGSRTLRGRAFSAVWTALRLWRPKAARVVYWIGSDVMRAVEDHDAARGAVLAREAALCSNICVAPWLSAELRTIGIDADVVGLPVPVVADPAETPSLPEAFTVLSYVPERKSTFYGGPQLMAAARAMPHAQFLILGEGRWSAETPPNVRFLGWVQDIGAAYAQASVVVRCVEHDGMPTTVVEGLRFARHVICTSPVPHTIRLEFGDTLSLIKELERLHARHVAATLGLNMEGRAYAIREFDPKTLSSELVGHLERLRAVKAT